MLERLALIAAFACAVNGTIAMAQPFPQRPVRVIVPSATGAATDVVARLLAQKLTLQFGKPIIVDNRPGAGNVIGTDIVAKALPDGHTIGLVYTPHTVNASLQAKLPFDPIDDFSAVTMLTSAPLVLALTANLPVKSFLDLVALATTKPLAYGSAGLRRGDRSAVRTRCRRGAWRRRCSCRHPRGDMRNAYRATRSMGSLACSSW